MHTTLRTARRLLAARAPAAALAAGAALALLACTGCTTSKVQQRYDRHLTTVVTPNAPGYVDQVALVFGLDSTAPSNTSIAAARSDNTAPIAQTALASRTRAAAAPLPGPVD